ncbi:hypothetical protein CEQ07_05135 [Oligella urethralis]|uniref:MarR family transcriptional regulator n=1 Tax=Oligella urethralis TaxID=90245 RepID=UPI000CFFACE0|nr:MarR family transcriptional regulator [Oligella urethralis]AVL70852.1 hypothetical protein CEQ07_05135 [Oligella urethralis]
MDRKKTLTDLVLETLKKPMTTREVSNVLQHDLASVASVCGALEEKGLANVVGYRLNSRGLYVNVYGHADKHAKTKETRPNGVLTTLILEKLKSHGALTSAEVAGYIGRSHGHMSSVLSRMVQAGLIYKTRMKIQNTKRYINLYHLEEVCDRTVVTLDDTRLNAKPMNKPKTKQKKTKIDKKLSKQFRVFKPRVGSVQVMGVWMV